MTLRRPIPVLLLLLSVRVAASAQDSHFSPLDQINKRNVANLRVAWRYHAGNSSSELNTSMECTPLIVGNAMYVTSPVMEVISLDAATGRENWKYNPFPEKPSYTRLWLAIFLLAALLGIGYFCGRLIFRYLQPGKVYQAGAVAAPLGLLLLLQGSRPVPDDPLAKRLVRRVLPNPALEQRHSGPSRGVTYWADGADQRILFAGGHRLVALDANSGRPIDGFGKNGVVDLSEGLGRQIDGEQYAVTSPGVIYKNLIVIGSMMGEGPGPVPPGDVRAFDVRTGQQKWVFHTIPHTGETGYETWPPDAWQHMGGANDWAGMTLDQARGLVFLPIGSAAFDYYGGDRTGQNLFTDSLVAVRAETGALVWHYQMVHHDLWDYDLPCPPTLVTVQRDGKAVDALAQPTKQGFVFVLNRDTGEPLFPVEEKRVPASEIPGEHAWPTQPFPAKPRPLNRLAIAENDLTDLSPEAHAGALARFRTIGAAAIFAPPSFKGTLVVPGFQGGANWGGAAFDPETVNLIVNTTELPYLLRVMQNTAKRTKAGWPYTVENFSDSFVSADGFPAIRPPWGRLSAVNLNSGEIRWQVPLGEYENLTKRGIPVTGADNIGGAVITRGGLIFIAATKDQKFRAFDAKTGQTLWQTSLSASGHATPSVYAVKGKQYVVIAAGGGSIAESFPSGDEYVAFSLPDKGTL